MYFRRKQTRFSHMQPKKKQNDGDDLFSEIEEYIEGVVQLAETQSFFCRSPMFKTGADGLHILRAMNAFLGMKSAELDHLIDKQIGPPPEWN